MLPFFLAKDSRPYFFQASSSFLLPRHLLAITRKAISSSKPTHENGRNFLPSPELLMGYLQCFDLFIFMRLIEHYHRMVVYKFKDTPPRKKYGYCFPLACRVGDKKVMH